MPLTDLAYTKAERREEVRECSAPSMNDAPAYPWGLCISLERGELDKLGIKALPGVGDEFHMTVVAKVTSVNQELGPMRSDEHCRVGLQITMAEVLMHETAAEERAEERAKGPETPAKESAEMRRPGSVLGGYR